VLPTVNNWQGIIAHVENQSAATPPTTEFAGAASVTAPASATAPASTAAPASAAAARRRRRGSGGFSRRRAGALAAALALAAVGVVAGVLASSGSGPRHSHGAATVTTASVATFRSAMIAKLDAQKAHFFWVVCVPSGAHFEGVRVVRCNVDFGDPHIQAYCSVFRGGHLVTSADDPTIPCRPDDAGSSPPIKTYN
jgi:hypothetical protein